MAFNRSSQFNCLGNASYNITTKFWYPHHASYAQCKLCPDIPGFNLLAPKPCSSIVPLGGYLGSSYAHPSDGSIFQTLICITYTFIHSEGLGATDERMSSQTYLICVSIVFCGE